MTGFDHVVASVDPTQRFHTPAKFPQQGRIDLCASPPEEADFPGTAILRKDRKHRNERTGAKHNRKSSAPAHAIASPERISRVGRFPRSGASTAFLSILTPRIEAQREWGEATRSPT